MRKQQLSPEIKQQIYQLYSQGLTHPEIADQLRIDNPQQVAGVVRAGLNFGKIKPRSGEAAAAAAPRPMPEPIQMSGGGSATLEAPPPPPPVVQKVTPPAVPQPVPLPTMEGAPIARPVHVARERMQPPPPAVEPGGADGGFSGAWAPAGSFTGGFNNQNLNIRYVVYREEPADGILGEHTHPFSETELARTYGRGLYKIQRFDPGNPRPYQISVRVSDNYGESRFSNRQNSAPTRQNYSRWSQRPWMRPSAESQNSEEEARPLERPSLYDYSRHAPSGGDAAVEAIKAMGQMNVKGLELADQARRQGPDSFVTKFFGEQQALWQKQLEENRRNDEQRRRDEEEKWERRQKEAEAEHKRRQEDEEKRHDRELAKIKADSEARAKEAEASRKQLLDLEGAKLKVIEEQNKLRQEALNDELKRNREQQKEQQERLEKQLAEMAEATQAQIAENQQKLEKELERERQALDREHKLREKGQDKEHELNTKILDIKQTALEAQGTNEIFQVVNNVINKFSSGLNQIIELKKLEAMTPEAQAAAVNKGHIDGNVMTDPKKPDAPVESRATQGAAAAGAVPAVSGEKTGNGQAAVPAGEVQGEINMKEIIRQMVDQPFFKGVLEEWATHVDTEQDGTTFLNMYREWMCDPNDHEGRKATTMFANFIAPRPWEKFYPIIKDKLDKETVVVFDKPHAKVFYETFRVLITEQIRAFWEDFGQQREAINAGRRAAGIEKEPSQK